MKPWIQRVRGALGTGLTWAAGWVPLGALTGSVTAALLDLPVGVVTSNYAVMFGVLGFVGGTIFSTVIRFAEGRRRFEQLSLRRFVAWGALGGLALGGVSVAVGLLGAGVGTLGAVMVSKSTILGAGSAAATLWIARSRGQQDVAEWSGPAGGRWP